MFTYKGLKPKEKVPTKQITFSLMLLFVAFLIQDKLPLNGSSKEEGCFS